MTHTDRSTFLRRLLIADAAISGASGLLLFAAAGLLERWLALPAPLLRYSGFSLLPFAAVVLYLAKRDVLSRTGVWTVIVLNAAWVVASAALLLAGNVERFKVRLRETGLFRDLSDAFVAQLVRPRFSVT